MLHDMKTDGPVAERSRQSRADSHRGEGWQKRKDDRENDGRGNHKVDRKGSHKKWNGGRGDKNAGSARSGSARSGNVKIIIDPDRMAAYKTLVKIEKSKAYSNIELNTMMSDEIVNQGFVRELVYGVIRNRRYLDYYIDELARDGIESIRPEVVVLLRTGLYQIIFMDSVPAHAAVDETVKIAKLLFPGRGGFVNGLLRSFIRLHVELDFKAGSDAGKADPENAEARIELADRGLEEPVFAEAMEHGRDLDEPVLAEAMEHGRGLEEPVFVETDDSRRMPIPDIADDMRRLSVMYSCDEGLVRLIAGQYGKDDAEKFLKVSLETPPLFVRVNTIKTSTASLAESLRSQGFAAELYKGSVYEGHASDTLTEKPSDASPENTDHSNSYPDILIVSGRGILETKEFRDGLFFVQDASSGEAVEELNPVAGEVLIDVCAAPGGKTFAAAIGMQNSGVIHAMDLHGNKLRALTKEAKRLGITIIDTEEHDAKTVLEQYAGAADKVICDVPCSGLGVLRRKPEIKDRPLKNDGRDLAEIQYMILCSSSEYVKAGGELMYSTCTINKIENEGVTDRFLSEHEDFKVRCSRHIMPCSGGPDGFYYCIMQRENAK